MWKEDYHPWNFFKADLRSIHFDSLKKWYMTLYNTDKLQKGLTKKDIISHIEDLRQNLITLGVQKQLVERGLTQTFVLGLKGGG